jgi:hypothetical protein
VDPLRLIHENWDRLPSAPVLYATGRALIIASWVWTFPSVVFLAYVWANSRFFWHR